MFSLNISCSICKVAFKNNDTIYSTSCGHVLHLMCMNQCRSGICPICRSPNYNPHPIYIHFENGNEYEKVVNKLRENVESYEEINKNLLEQMDKKIKEKDCVKRLYNVSEQWRAELQDKIQTLTQQRQQQNDEHSKLLTEHLEEIKVLKTHIKVLEKENVEELTEEYKQLFSENAELKKNLYESETLKIKLNQKIEMQEIRLKHITLELTKQFDESHEKDSKAKSLGNDKDKRTRTLRKKSDKNGKSEAGKNVSITNSNISVFDSKEGDSFELTQNKNCKIMILDLPKENLVYPLKYTIILLASKMAITLTYENILYANIIPSKSSGKTFNTVVILTEFKNIENKIQFLKFKNRLNGNPTTKGIKIKEYIDVHIYPLFVYANRRLRNNGYEYIACKDNKVIAKKKLHDVEEIVIKDQNHVDALLRCQTASAENIPTLPYFHF